jgi:KDO2-lipid IV(A) lauroyltransferase
MLKAILEMLGRLPLGLVQWIGTLLGFCFAWTPSRMRAVTRENIALCFPELDETAQRQLVRDSLVETGRTIAESAFAWTASVDRCRASITDVAGKEFVDEAIDRGQGLIFVIPHLGNWEVINHYLGSEYGLTHMYQRNHSKELNRLIQQYRSRTGTKFVEANRAGIREQLEVLRGGGTVGAMPDQEPEVHTGSFARFFGVPCLTNTLIPNLARRTGAEAVIAWCARSDSASGFSVRFTPLDLSGDLGTGLEKLNHGIEETVRHDPAQYLWSYKRFRTRPDGDPELYQFRQHPMRVFFDTLVLKALLGISRRLPLPTIHATGKSLGNFMSSTRHKHARSTRTNLTFCAPALLPIHIRQLEKDALRELGKTAMELGLVWNSSTTEFDKLCLSIEGLEHMPESPGAPPVIVLTPPLGQREVVMRLLGDRFRATDYYHPNSNTARDDLIRVNRASMGIGLVLHTNDGVAALAKRLNDGEVVTLCPDQQPRLRGGEFIPFFARPALTTRVIVDLVRETGARLVFGAAIRESRGFRIYFHPLSIAAACDTVSTLTAINHQLEQIILQHPEQYRWSDKRFNIRPQGDTKVYR